MQIMDRVTQFFRLLWRLKYSEELKGIAALSNMKACHKAKYNVMLKSKDFRDLNQPGATIPQNTG